MKLFSNFASALLILLFCYTAFTKLTDFERFRSELSRSALLSNGAFILAVVLPLVELFVSALLFFENSRVKGFQASLALLILFTSYLVYIVLTHEDLPCTCGGVIQQLDWQEHIVLNLFFILLSATALFFHRPNKTI